MDEVELLSRYTPLVRRLARRLSGPAIEPADAAQEGYIGLIRAARSHGSAPLDRFPKYAKMRCRGAILNAMHRHAGPIHVPQEAWADPSWTRLTRQHLPADHPRFAAGDDDGDEWRDDMVSRLRGALATLEAGDAELLARRYGLGGRDEESPSELASEMGVRPEAMRKRLERLRGRLRAVIEAA